MMKSAIKNIFYTQSIGGTCLVFDHVSYLITAIHPPLLELNTHLLRGSSVSPLLSAHDISATNQLLSLLKITQQKDAF